MLHPRNRITNPAGARYFYIVLSDQNSSGAHGATYSKNTVVSFPGVKTAGVKVRKLGPIYYRDEKCVDLYFHFSMCLHGFIIFGVLMRKCWGKCRNFSSIKSNRKCRTHATDNNANKIFLRKHEGKRNIGRISHGLKDRCRIKKDPL